MPPRTGSRRVLLFTQEDPLVLSSGEQLPEVEVSYETWGTLDAQASNAVFICHALTGDAHAADWWSTLVGPGRPVDTDRFFVICANLLGGCAGTTGPRSISPETGLRYGTDFPLLSVADLVAVHRRLVTHLGISRLHAAVGGSLGGMQVLQWALDAPHEIDRAVVIAASSRLSAQNIAFSAVGRRAVLDDPDFLDGRYTDGAGPRHGLAVARMMAHITYVSEGALETKFGRSHQAGAPTPGLGVDFSVESYLDHQGRSFLERFDATSYLYLSRLMDYFDPFPDPVEPTDGEHGVTPDAAPGRPAVDTSFLVISFDSDWRFDTTHSRRIVHQLETAGIAVRFREVHAPHGHDSFLMEAPGYQSAVAEHLT